MHSPINFVVQVPHQPRCHKERLCTLHGQVEASSLLGLPLLDDSSIKGALLTSVLFLNVMLSKAGYAIKLQLCSSVCSATSMQLAHEVAGSCPLLKCFVQGENILVFSQFAQIAYP